MLLTQVQGEVDRVWVLDPIEHGLALPPGVFLAAVEVREEAGAVAQPRLGGVAAVAGASHAHLHAVFFRRRATRVGRLHAAIEGQVLEFGHAASWGPFLVVAGVHGGSGSTEMQ